MLPSRPSFAIGMNVFGEVWTTDKSLNSSGTCSRGQTPRSNTPRYVQGVEAKLEEHKRVVTMFKQVTKYNVQMTNIFLRLFRYGY
jgi:hypothetical protein